MSVTGKLGVDPDTRCPVRTPGLAMTRHQDGSVCVLNHTNTIRCSLNQTLADILSLCDGSRDLPTLLDTLESLYDDATFSMADILSGVEQLADQRLIRFATDEPNGELICVSFEGFDPAFDVLDNYLTYALSLIDSVLIVDPKQISPDVLLVLQPAGVPSAELPADLDDSTMTIQVACFGVGADLDRYDFSISGGQVAAQNAHRHMRLAIRDSHDPVLSSHHDAAILPGTVRPDHCAEKIGAVLFQRDAVPDKNVKNRKLTIGMATYDDYDGVYFTIQSLRLFHPEVDDQVLFLILDNNPAGYAAASLKALASDLPHVCYLPFSGFTGTATREQLFHYAESDWVLCLDSHVMLVPGALARLIEYIDGLDDPWVLLQGPLLDDRLDRVLTHFEPKWHDGMYGTWATDERGLDADADPFDIEMQGLGLFACKRHTWPGLNPGFRGFGGEEGYLHEKFRRAGGRTLCLPFLRWVHRFRRPQNVPYKITWEDRVRNYLLAYHELGWDTDALREHFSTLVDPAVVQDIESSLGQSGEQDA